MLRLYYEGTDMTAYANLKACVYREYAFDRADCLEAVFDHAAAWHRWDVQAGDAIEADRDGYTTGRLYLNSIAPEGDGFRLVATSIPATAQRRAWAAYRQMTFLDIVHHCAAECALSDAAYGFDGDC